MRRPPAPVDTVIDVLSRKYEAKTPSLDPFRVLIFTILSQRTRDENSEAAADALLSVFPTVRELAAADPAVVEKLIHPAGFYRAKAKSVISVSRILLKEYGGEVPDTLDELLALPSVGRKTANCVLVYGFGLDALPVDTHVHRISNRLGWVDTADPDSTEFALMKVVPKAYWKTLNSLLIDFGRRTCQPRKTRCGSCPIEALCPSSMVGGGE